MKNSIILSLALGTVLTFVSCNKKHECPEPNTNQEVVNVKFVMTSYNTALNNKKSYDRAGAPIGISEITVQNFWYGDGNTGDIDKSQTFPLANEGGDPIIMEGIRYGANNFGAYANQYPDLNGDGSYDQSEIPNNFMDGGLYYQNPELLVPNVEGTLFEVNEGVFYKHWGGKMVDLQDNDLSQVVFTNDNVSNGTYENKVNIKMTPSNSIIDLAVNNTSNFNHFTTTVYLYNSQLLQTYEFESMPNEGFKRYLLNHNYLQKNVKMKIEFRVFDNQGLDITTWANNGEFIIIQKNKRYYIGSNDLENAFDISDENPNFLVDVPLNFIWEDLFENEEMSTTVDWTN